jgi:membrane-bound lytic murein transglycosylase A
MVGQIATRSAQPFAVALLLAMAACAPAPPENKLVLAPVAFADLPGWQADRQSEAIPALLRSCMSLAQRQDSAPAGPGDAFGRVVDWRPACAAAGSVPSGDDDAARLYFDRWFKPFRALNGDRPTGFLTGYYEPELRGSRAADARYWVPLYRRPADLVTAELGDFRDTFRGERIAGRVVDGRLRPYANRAAIDAGALAGQGLELLWVDDPVDAFFLHVQGSGRVVLADGSVVRVGYAAANGHTYTAIGRELIARGEVAREAMSMQAIRDWLAAHPAEAKSVMAANASFVFFRELEGDGPVGSQGVVLTPGRSLAVDTRFMALGAPVWIDSLDPLTPDVPLRRLMVSQDTGGAIRGPLRGDVFWGNGSDAAARAGRMQSSAELYVLLPAAAVPAPTN